jgi:DNA invertase Pin-like site-specific DNA recombinase
MRKANANTVTLVRVSTKKQGGEDRFGMDAQRRSNERTVAEHGFTVRKTIEYKDVSGDAVMYTPEMQELQAFLRSPEMNGGNLVAKELSRLLRPNYTDYPLLQVFVDQRISIHLPHYVLQLWTPEGRMLASVLCATDFNEAERIRERCMGGREESRRLGFCAAGGRTVPTGVTWDVKSKTWGYDSVYSPKIAAAFQTVASGETNFGYIVRKLNLCLRPNRSAPKLATATDLRRLLENRMFIGERVTNLKSDLSIPKDKLMFLGKDHQWHKRTRPLIAREPDEIYVKQVITPGLVSREMFEKVQTILRAKSDKTHQTHALHSERPKFTYRGLLFCADCGQPLYTVTQRDGFYRCRDHFRNRGGTNVCKAASMGREKLEAELDRLFSQEFPRKHFLAELLEKQYGSEGRRDNARQRERLLRQKETLSKKRGRIIEFALDGTLTKEDRDRRLKLVDDDLDLNSRALTDLADTPLPSLREWHDFLRPFNIFETLSLDAKRRLLTSRFQEIRVKDYRLVSLYLLTGEVTTPKAETCHSCGLNLRQGLIALGGRYYCEPCAVTLEGPERIKYLQQANKIDPNRCYSCGHTVAPSLRVTLDGLTYCGPCSDGVGWRPSYGQDGEIPAEVCNDTYQRL